MSSSTRNTLLNYIQSVSSNEEIKIDNDGWSDDHYTDFTCLLIVMLVDTRPLQTYTIR